MIGLSGGDGDNSAEANVDSTVTFKLNALTGLSGGDGDGADEANVDSYTEYILLNVISVIAEPGDGGNVTGGGEYDNGDEVTVSAEPAEGYRFVNWTENGTEVSTDADYTFTATQSRELTANFIPVYTVRFENYDGAELQTGEVVSGDIPSYGGETPERPDGDGYTYEFAAWSPEITAATENTTYTATYTKKAIKYTATFTADGETVDKVEFTVETYSITEPEVPAKDGYEGKWSEYTLAANDITIQAEYTVIEYTAVEYTAKFVDENGGTVAEVPYTVGTDSITEPEVPAKDGYEGKWSEYSLAAGDITIRAEYTAIEYKATFVDENGGTIAEVPYTVETESIEAPAVPEKAGYAGGWEEYTLEIGGITVKPVYTVTNVDVNVEIDGGSDEAIGYRKDKTFTVSVENLPEGAEIHWIVNGEYVGTGESYTVEDPTGDYNISAAVVDADGNILYETQVRAVKVRNGFMDKLKWFFSDFWNNFIKAVIDALFKAC